jgi:hypothetical protein
MPDDDELMEMRCRTCGILLGVRKRQGPFVFWCSDECADTVNAKSERDQVRDEVAVELYLGGVGIMEVARFTETPYTRIQQLLYRRNIPLVRPARKVPA